MASLTINDFSGGLTDSPFTSELNCAEVANNVLIKKDKTLVCSYGADIYSASASRVPSTKRISNFVKLADDRFIAFSNTRAYEVTPSGITEIVGPVDSNKAFNLGDENSIVSIAPFNGQFLCTNDALSYPVKFYIDGDGNVQMRSAGLPPPASAPVITPSVASTKVYIYAFTYYYEYRVGTTLFSDESALMTVQKTNGATMSGTTMDISAIPVLSNGADYNHDTATVKVKIYRTTDTGSTFYYVDEVTNGTTVYVDSTTDATLVNSTTLYTTGGIRENDVPPPAKYVFTSNDTYYYLDIIQGGEQRPSRGIQSITNDPDSVPSDFLIDFSATAKGGGTVGRSPIVFTESSTIRIDGILDETGAGSILRETISKTVGTVAHNSIVEGPMGLFFAAKDGFYYTNGYAAPTKLARRGANASKIDSIYKALVVTDEQKSRIQGTYDPLNNRIYWTVQRNATDNDVMFIYDTSHDSFTTLSSASGILPTAILFDGEDLIVGDANGYIFKYSSEYYTEPVIEIGVAVSSWNESAVIYNWKSVQLDMGNSSVNKWITKINAQGNPETNVNLGIYSYTNGETEYKEIYPMRIVPGLIWGDVDFTWGDDAFVWNRTSSMNQTRSFPKGRLRARQRQIEFTNAYYTILSSTVESASFVTINAASKLATLVTPASYTFGLNNEGYDLLIDGRSCEIASGTVDTLTLLDPDLTLSDGTYSWSIMGYGKGQRPHLLNYTIIYENMGDSAGTMWRGGDTK
jgi:hypothetical protein